MINKTIVIKDRYSSALDYITYNKYTENQLYKHFTDILETTCVDGYDVEEIVEYLIDSGLTDSEIIEQLLKQEKDNYILIYIEDNNTTDYFAVYKESELNDNR